MSVHPKLATALVLTAVLALALPGAALAARTHRKPSNRWIAVEVPKTNGWRLYISGIFSPQLKHETVSISAEGPHQVHVGYGVHGHLAPDGTISAKFPGIGVVDSASARPANAGPPPKTKAARTTGQRTPT